MIATKRPVSWHARAGAWRSIRGVFDVRTAPVADAIIVAVAGTTELCFVSFVGMSEGQGQMYIRPTKLKKASAAIGGIEIGQQLTRIPVGGCWSARSGSSESRRE